MSNSSRINRKFERMLPNAKQPHDYSVSKNIQQTDCYVPLPHDLKLLEKLWYGRNPCHEANADSGEDMFWVTVACVIDDYITAVHGNGI